MEYAPHFSRQQQWGSHCALSALLRHVPLSSPDLCDLVLNSNRLGWTSVYILKHLLCASCALGMAARELSSIPVTQCMTPA